MKAIACIVLIIGLLKFATDAPALFKTLFSFGEGLFSGVNFNPRGQMRGDLQAAAGVVRGAGNALATPFRNAGRHGKQAFGAVRGAAAGASAQDGFFNKVTGGFRGMVAGARAGGNHEGFRGTGRAAAFAGAGASSISNRNRTAYGQAQGNYNTMVGELMNLKKVDVDKLKASLTNLESEYKGNVNDYITSKAEEYSNLTGAARNNKINEGRAARLNDIKEEMIAKKAKEAKMSVADYKASNEYRAIQAQIDADAQDQLNRENLNGQEAMNYAARKEAEGLYKDTYEREKRNLERKIAETQGAALAGNEDSAIKAYQEFTRSQRDWGDEITSRYRSNFDSNMRDIKNTDIADTVNDVMRQIVGDASKIYAGAGAKDSLSNNDIRKLTESINQLANKSNRTAQENLDLTNQRMVLAQLMNQMDSAAKKTNSNISVAQTALNTYTRQTANNNNNGGGGDNN